MSYNPGTGFKESLADQGTLSNGIRRHWQPPLRTMLTTVNNTAGARETGQRLREYAVLPRGPSFDLSTHSYWQLQLQGIQCPPPEALLSTYPYIDIQAFPELKSKQ